MPSTADWVLSGLRPRTLGADHPDQVHRDDVQHRAFARGKLHVAEQIRRRFAGGGGAAPGVGPAAAAAARAAGQASAIPHMGAHALGAAAYAAKAMGLAAPERPEAVSEEIVWQLASMSDEVRAALRKLPQVGENRSGPLGPGLLASGIPGAIIRDLQAGLAGTDRRAPPRSVAADPDGPGHPTGAADPRDAGLIAAGLRDVRGGVVGRSCVGAGGIAGRLHSGLWG